MKRIFCLLMIIGLPLAAQEWPMEMLTKPERTAYRETSTYAEVMALLAAVVEGSPYAHLTTMGKSADGKDIPVVILSNPSVTTAEAAKATQKPIIYVQGNIHSGEVEGKEILQILLREILHGDKTSLLDHQILLFAPIYSADSNDKLEQGRRPSQEDSPIETGIRPNSQGWDLNRDGIKAEGAETRALLQNIIVPWDPDVFVDLHTTNGVWHGYSLTWAPSYHTAGEKAPYDFTWDKLLPKVTQEVLAKDDIHLGPYGYFYPQREGWPIQSISTYNHHPRYLVNQFGLRNRMAILSEAFAHERLYQRMNSTQAFVREILTFTNANAQEIRRINQQAEADAIQTVIEQSGRLKKGVRFKMVALDEPIKEYRAYNYIKSANAEGRPMYVRKPEIITLNNVENKSAFEATVEATLPRGYVIPQAQPAIVEHLRRHGVEVKTMDKRMSATGEVFVATALNKARRPFEGHMMATLEGDFQPDSERFQKGDYYVDLAQPLANLIFYMLEPQSDDGLVNWNFFDTWFEEQGIDEAAVRYPIFKYFELK